MARVYETMRRAEIKATGEPKHTRFVIRLWIDGHDLAYADHAIVVAVDLATQQETPYQAAQVIDEHLVYLNAVEVVDGQGQGSVIYRDWP